jgi:hypothetical protein
MEFVYIKLVLEAAYWIVSTAKFGREFLIVFASFVVSLFRPRAEGLLWAVMCFVLIFISYKVR